MSKKQLTSGAHKLELVRIKDNGGGAKTYIYRDLDERNFLRDMVEVVAMLISLVRHRLGPSSRTTKRRSNRR